MCTMSPLVIFKFGYCFYTWKSCATISDNNENIVLGKMNIFNGYNHLQFIPLGGSVLCLPARLVHVSSSMHVIILPVNAVHYHT